MSPTAGFTCAYTPLPVIHAAGLTPHRLLPTAQDGLPDQAGALLHDNLCPHVKRVLDRAVADRLPDDLAGVVLMNSCDAMRRLADAWSVNRPRDRVVLVDLPTTTDESAVAFFATELDRLAAELGSWAGQPVDEARLTRSVALYAELQREVARLRWAAGRGQLPGGFAALQSLLNRAATEPPEAIIEEVRATETGPAAAPAGGVPVYLVGNVLSDPQALGLLEECGTRIVDDDLCTGSRLLTELDDPPAGETLAWLARRQLRRPPCARTMQVDTGLAQQIVARAGAVGARGVIVHVLKFCDPYLARLPALRTALRQAGLPLLVLEGDCTLRSLGQHRTRIEAFVEMLG